MVEMCQVLNVSRSGYYRWLESLEAEPTPRQQRQLKVKQRIFQIFHENHGTYGAVRIHKELLSEGIKVSERTVGRYMQAQGLKANKKSPYMPTTDSNHKKPVYKNLLEQDFEADKPNEVWVSDITYIWTKEGWMYLAAFIDLYSRKVVGWSIADHMRKELVLDALNMAISARQPEKGLIIHSDRGSQYVSTKYRKRLKKIKAKGSMSRKGNPYDNAVMESFFATLKKDYVYRNYFETKEEARRRIYWWIL